MVAVVWGKGRGGPTSTDKRSALVSSKMQLPALFPPPRAMEHIKQSQESRLGSLRRSFCGTRINTYLAFRAHVVNNRASSHAHPTILRHTPPLSRHHHVLAVVNYCSQRRGLASRLYAKSISQRQHIAILIPLVMVFLQRSPFDFVVHPSWRFSTTRILAMPPRPRSAIMTTISNV